MTNVGIEVNVENKIEVNRRSSHMSEDLKSKICDFGKSKEGIVTGSVITVVSLVFFAPIGILLTWTLKKSWKKEIKIAATVLSSLFFMWVMFTNHPNKNVSPNTAVVVQNNNDKQAEQKQQEEKKQAEEKKQQEERKQAEEKKQQEEKKQAEDRRQEEEKKQQEAIKAQTAVAPAPEVAPVPAQSQSAPNQSYTSCDEMWKDHPGGAKTSDPWYNSHLDRDKDGYACEPKNKKNRR
ncbi:MAG: excalibur calcium-binding domain-containing protein [Culicoidibacterales bacterium]